MKLEKEYVIDDKVVCFFDRVGSVNIYRAKVDGYDDQDIFYFVDSEGNVLRRLCVFVNDYDAGTVDCNYSSYEVEN